MHSRNIGNTRPAKSSERVSGLDRGQIHLWLFIPGSGLTAGQLSTYRSIMDSGERDAEAFFVHLEDRHRYVATRAILRLVLSRYCDKQPSDWHFERTYYGRPFIANPAPDEQHLHFNLSHSRSAIAIAVSRNSFLGVDIEESPYCQSYMEIAETCCSAREMADLQSIPPDLQAQRFVEYWTLKEAYIKACGKGHTIPVEGVTFSFPAPGRLILTAGTRPHDQTSNWWFWQGRPTEKHVVAVCARCTPTHRPSVLVTQIFASMQERRIVANSVRRTY
jgi:4'-phosphopantetheinyl transferase